MFFVPHPVPTHQSPGSHLLARLEQAFGLGLAASLGHRLGEVGEEDGEPQPKRDLHIKTQFSYVATYHVSDQNNSGQHGSHGHDEHDRVFGLLEGSQLTDGIAHSPPYNWRIKQGTCLKTMVHLLITPYSQSLPGGQEKMLDYRPQRKRGEEGERTDNHHDHD